MDNSFVSVFTHPYAALITLAAASGGGLVGAWIAVWQGVLSRRGVRVQAMVSLHELAKQANYATGMVAIRRLHDVKSWKQFVDENRDHEAIHKLVYGTVEFLNFASHLVQERALPRQTVWNIYFHSYKDAAPLIDWWLKELRKENRQAFAAFALMCGQVTSRSEYQIHAFDDSRAFRRLVSGSIPWLAGAAMVAVIGATVYFMVGTLSALATAAGATK